MKVTHNPIIDSIIVIIVGLCTLRIASIGGLWDRRPGALALFAGIAGVVEVLAGILVLLAVLVPT